MENNPREGQPARPRRGACAYTLLPPHAPGDSGRGGSLILAHKALPLHVDQGQDKGGHAEAKPPRAAMVVASGPPAPNSARSAA